MKTVLRAIALGVAFTGVTVPAIATLTDGADILVGGTAHEAMFGVVLGEDGYGVAVGAGGANYISGDSGRSWKAQPQLTELSLFAVAASGSKRIAVGQMGIVFVQSDKGAWQKIDSGTEQRLMAVDINANGVAAAVGSFGTVLRSEDSGQTWHAVSPDWTQYTKEGLEPHLYAVKVANDGSLLIAGETGLILAASPAADAWKVLHKGDVEQQIEDASLFGIDIRKDGVGYAVGQAGTILKTEDTGRSWKKIESGTTETLLGVRSPVGGHVAVSTLHGVIASADDGGSWEAISPQQLGATWFSGITSSPDSNSIVTVGQAGRIVAVQL